VTDGAIGSDGSSSGGEDSGSDAQREGGAPYDGYMEGGGCSCSAVPDGRTQVTNWLLVGLGVAVHAFRRRRR
jgi:MYXO-CTERM domain-containing protein